MTAVLPALRQRLHRLRAFVARVSPRARDVVAVLGSLGGGLLYGFSLDGKAPGDWVFVVLLLTVLGSLSLWWRRSHPLAVTLIGLVVAVVTAYPVPVAIGVMTLAVRRRDRLLAMVVGLCYLADVTRELVTGANPFSTVVVSALFWSAITSIGAYVGARRDLLVSLRLRAETAEAERELRADQARLSERHRIAQEMHDVLAHKVSLIALHAGALEVNPDAGPEQVERSAALVRTTAREALDDLRRVLGVLRAEAPAVEGAELVPTPGIESLESLVASSRAAGIDVRLDCSIDLAGGAPPADLGRTTFRVVQESLTNVHKHARSAATTVRVWGRAGDGLDVEVRNRAPVSAGTLLPGAGLGLVGLTERVAVVRGALDWGPCPDGGWQVHAHLPWEEAA